MVDWVTEKEEGLIGSEDYLDFIERTSAPYGDIFDMIPLVDWSTDKDMAASCVDLRHGNEYKDFFACLREEDSPEILCSEEVSPEFESRIVTVRRQVR